jgi:hypothetical protein
MNDGEALGGDAVAARKVVLPVDLGRVGGPSVGLHDHRCVVEQEVHPGHEPRLAVGDDILLDEREPGGDQQGAYLA